MKTDLYTKVALTVIAIALSVISVRMEFSGSARAMGEGCGDSRINPCYITAENNSITRAGLEVYVTNWPD